MIASMSKKGLGVLLKRIGLLIVLVLCAVGLLYVAAQGANHVYVSGDFAASGLSGFYDIPGADIYRWLGLSDPGPIRVDQLAALHALRNIVFMLSVSFILGCVSLLVAATGLGLAVVGLFTLDWGGDFLGGLLLLPLAILVGIGSPFVMVIIWLMLLFQPCTLSYVVIWMAGLVIILPSMAFAGWPALLVPGRGEKVKEKLFVLVRVK